MKTLSILAALLLAGCASPMGNLGRVWPDGASVTMKGVHATASMTGGAFDAAEISWTGTNGYPVPGAVTNSTTTSTNMMSTTTVRP